MASDEGRVELTGDEIKKRRSALGLSTARLAAYARVSVRALQKAERDDAGQTVLTRVGTALDKLEAGEVIEPDPTVLRVELRPGVWVTVDAENVATLGDLREVEAKIRQLIDENHAP